MENVKKWLGWLGRWEYTWVLLVVLATLVIHFILITTPGEPLFDEQHYVPDARSIIAGNGTLRFEHPPLGKLFIVSGMLIFGDNPWGWRFFSVILGTASLWLFYLICRRLNMSRRSSSLAVFLLGFENLTFLQASVAMLDVYTVFFMMLSFWLYLRGNYLSSGAAIALSSLAKLTGVLALPAICLHWFFVRRDRPPFFFGMLLTALLSFVGFMTIFDFAVFRHFVNPVERIATMMTLSGSLTFATVNHGCANRPWDWIFSIQIIPYWYKPNYIGAISFNVWALIIPSFGYMVFRAVKRASNAGFFAASWFFGTYLLWIPISAITNRVSYLFYFYPTVGAVCIGLGIGLSQLLGLWQRRKTGKLRWLYFSLVPAYLVLHILIFINLSPVSYWWGGPWFYH